MSDAELLHKPFVEYASIWVGSSSQPTRYLAFPYASYTCEGLVGQLVHDYIQPSARVSGHECTFSSIRIVMFDLDDNGDCQ